MNDLPIRDIHLPDSSLWWPPAPAWWFSVLALLLLPVLLYRLWRYWKRGFLGRQALMELGKIETQYLQVGDRALLIREVSKLLRRILISYQGRSPFAGCTGERWLQQLGKLAAIDVFGREQQALLARAQYQSNPEFDAAALISNCRRWIRALPPRRGDV